MISRACGNPDSIAILNMLHPCKTLHIMRYFMLKLVRVV